MSKLSYNNLSSYYKSNKIQLLLSIISTYIIGVIAHAYGFLNNIFSHDSLNAMYADATENSAKISVGRFMVPLVRYFIRGQLAIPWLIGILALFYVSVSVYLVVKLFNVNSKALIIFISALMVTNITVTGCVATYIHEFDIDMFALMFAVFSVYLWRTKKGILCSIFSTVLIVISLGIYQSNLTVVTTLIICCLIIDLMNGASFKKTFFKGLQGLSEITAGAISYYALSKIIINISGISAQSRTDALNVTDFLTEDISYINGFNSMIYYEIQKIVNPISVLPKPIVIISNILLLLAGLFIVLLFIRKPDKKIIKEKFLSLVLIALLPVAIGFICILTKGELHDIMTYAFWLIPVFIVVLFSQLKNYESKTFLRKVISGIFVICIAITAWNNILVANTAYLKKDLEHDATLSAMTRMASDLDDRNDYTAGETKVYFVGSDFINGKTDEFDEIEKIIGLEYNTSIGMAGKEWYFCSYEKYFVNYMGQPLNHTDNSFITDEIHDRIINMPAFPNEGYMQKFGDVLVIKMS